VQKEQINVNGKRLNKLEEVVRLLQKLNEDLYSKEQIEENGYPFSLYLKADGSGDIEGNEILFRFDTTLQLEEYLKAGALQKLIMTRGSVFNECSKRKGA
jgi:hypothetical protein